MIVCIDTNKKEIRISGVNNIRNIGDLIDAILQNNMANYHLIADDRKIVSSRKKKVKGDKFKNGM